MSLGMNNEEKQRKYLKYMAKGGVVLELGSGSGDFLRICREADIEAAGVEKNTKASCVKEFKVFKSDLRTFLQKEKSGKYTNIYARHILEHFYPEDLKKLFSNAYRIMKKGGKFIAVFPNTRNLNVVLNDFWKDETHARPYAREAVTRMLEEAGFKIVQKGPDTDSWDNSFIKNIIRRIRGLITGFAQEPPDCFVVAGK
jgi:cyclopropane fatty-acyl-phospholipid synthase-like methyltransferase